jgi:hypothetical protein
LFGEPVSLISAVVLWGPNATRIGRVIRRTRAVGQLDNLPRETQFATYILSPQVLEDTTDAISARLSTVTGYRSEPRTRMIVDELGNISITRPRGRRRRGVSIFIGFDRDRAYSWLEREGKQYVVAFEVEEEFLDRLRRTATPEAEFDRVAPARVDIGYPDQFMIPPGMFDELEEAIIPGSGRILRIEDF